MNLRKKEKTTDLAQTEFDKNELAGQDENTGIIIEEKKKKKVGGAAEANADATEKELELSLDEDGFAEENNEGKRASEDRSIAEKEEEK